MSHFAGRVIKRLGNTDEAYQQFLKQAEKCAPPLESDELNSIWNSAVKFGKKVSKQAGYIPPEQYNADMKLKPDDYSDIGRLIELADCCVCYYNYKNSASGTGQTVRMALKKSIPIVNLF